MDQLTVRPCTVADLADAPEFEALAQEYAAEAGRAISLGAAPQIDIYKSAESAGNMLFAGAWLDEKLVGFLVLALYIVPHYGTKIAATESIFVTESARNTGAGKQMLKQAESIACDAGATGLAVSAPIGGRLAKILPHIGFKHTNELFFKGLS